MIALKGPEIELRQNCANLERRNTWWRHRLKILSVYWLGMHKVSLDFSASGINITDSPPFPRGWWRVLKSKGHMARKPPDGHDPKLMF